MLFDFRRGLLIANKIRGYVTNNPAGGRFGTLEMCKRYKCLERRQRHEIDMVYSGRKRC